MHIIVFVGIIFILLGAVVGFVLAAKGVSGDLSLHNHHSLTLSITVILSGAVFLFIFIDSINQLGLVRKLLPTFVLLYVGAYIQNIVFALACFILGLIVGLEAPGVRSSRRMIQLFMSITMIACLLSILLYYSLPITKLIRTPKIVNGVVFQTTSFTCAPASIATLARFLKRAPNITEKDVALMTQTNRSGTSTLAQIDAMQKLGLNPDYQEGFSLEQLATIGAPAILHVREKYQGKVVPHAVTLLYIDKDQQTLTIANPLKGLEVKSFEQMRDYWNGEVIFAK